MSNATTRTGKQYGFTTLDACVRGALMDIGAGLERYEQMKHYGIDIIREFKFDMAQEVKTVALELTAWKAITLPDDYVDWAMIGVNINGAIRVLTHDDRIPFPTEDEQEDGYPPDIASLETLPETRDGNVLNTETLSFWNYGEDPGGLFGLVAKDNGTGYFRLNRERKEIQFAPSIKSDTVVYLEYIADAISVCEKTVINLYAAKLVRLYIHWQRVKYQKSSSLAEILMHKKDYENEYDKVHTRLQKITVEDVLECARDGYRLTPWI